MATLELLVIATIIIAGAWVGYHAWQDSLHEKAEKHDIEIRIEAVHNKINSQLKSENAPLSTISK